MTETEKTPKNDDIDSIYSQIESTAMIQVKDSIELKRSLSSLSNHSTMSTSSNSSSNSSGSNSSSIYDDALEDTSEIMHSTCSCQHMLVSTDSDHCGLCDQSIPIVQELQQTRSKTKEKIANMKYQLDEKQSMLNLYGREANTLQNAFTRRQQGLEDMTNKIKSLHQDIEIVQLKHKDEIAHSLAIEHSKKLVENEMHDLTQKLFEEANNLVLKEKEEKLAIQLQHDKVHDDLLNAESQLAEVQSELQELRKDMAAKDKEPQQQRLNPQSSFSSFITTHENYLLRAQLDMASLLPYNSTQPIEINLDYHQQVLDNALLEEFQQFSIAIKSTGLAKMYTLPFMKNYLKSDIEPCLRFGPNPRLTSKKITDAVLVRTCLVEPCPQGFFQERMEAAQKVEAVKPKMRLWDRFSSSIPAEIFTGCQACGRVLDEEDDCWRFRISYFDEWALIDRYCYERIVSVIEFYSFLRKLKVGDYKEVDIFQVYQECSRLQLQMFLSRMGACATVLQEFGLDSTKIGSVYSTDPSP